MKKFEKWLGGLLAAQLFFAAALLWAGQSGQNRGTPEKLFQFEPAQITRIQLSDKEEKLVLERDGGKWTLPESHALPADGERAERLLRRVAALAGHWPVTTTEGSHERFEVAEDKHQRRLLLYRDDELVGELFVGTSPGLRQVHLRRAGEAAVYTGELPVYDIPLSTNDWLDRNLLAVTEVTAVEGTDFRIEKQQDNWNFTDSEQPADQDKALQLASTLTSLKVTGVAESAPEDVDEEFKFVIQADGREYEYRLLRKDKNHYISRGDLEPLFTWASTSYKKLAELDKESLTGKPPSEVAEKEADSENS